MNHSPTNPSERRVAAIPRVALATAAAVALLAPAVNSLAADGWLSRAIEIEPTGRSKVSLPTYWQKDHAPAISQRAEPSARTVFDITMSLYNAPAGDGDPNVDAGEPQETYESIVRYFADSVCEQTNGSHRLGKVRLFTSRNQQASADVVWTASIGPQANVSGFGASGLHIFFGDVFPGGRADGSDFDMLANPEIAGYTLGHEWGHYTYGLFDEYVGNDPLETDPRRPQSTDIGTSPSIMNAQWRAAGGNPSFLNHSTSDNFGNPARTAQGRVYGKSGWEVLVQHTSEDPKSGDRKAQPGRTQYSSLVPVEPGATDNWVKIELPTDQTACRSDLEIIWVDGDIDLQIVLDRSGSMAGTPITNAKQAASLLVDTTADGQTGLGVASFASSFVQNSPLQPIPDPGTQVKNQIKAIINSVGAFGSTRLYDGALSALSQLNDYQLGNATTAPQVVFLLSDGRDTSSRSDETDVVTAYQAANVPLFTFGFGDASPTGTLLQMANATGGQYTFSPTDLSEITQAFLQANAVASDLKNIVDTQQSVPVNTQASVMLPVDGGLESLSLVINFNGAATDVDFTLLDPTSAPVDEVTLDCQQINAVLASCSAQVDETVLTARGAGLWQLELANASAGQRDVNVYVAGLPGTQGSFSARVTGAAGNEIVYPAPIVLTTSVIRDLPITGVNLLAQITDPLGSTRSFAMSDDGMNGDATANDGIYSAILGYDANGTYEVEVRVDNDHGTARFTTLGLQPAHYAGTVDGSFPSQVTPPAISENFARVSRTNIVVTGRPNGDSNNSFFTAEELLADNQGVASVIDQADDLDYFVVRNVDTTSPLIVRATRFSLGMDPVLTVYADDATTELVSAAMLPANASTTGYLYASIPAGALTETVYAVIGHRDATATSGGFEISAGSLINTDMPPNAVPEAGSDVAALIEGVQTQINLLANDTDADGDTLTIEEIGASAFGATLTLGSDGSLTYDSTGRPFNLAPGDTLTDSILYTLTDGLAYRGGVVEITVTGNTPPLAIADLVETDADASVVIAVLANDGDADGQTLTLTAIDSSQTEGSVIDNGDGTVTYDPAGAFDSLQQGEAAAATFGYSITDEGGLTSSAIGTITVKGIEPPRSGGGGGGALNGLMLLALIAWRVAARRED
ncbi:MAG: Ig-like domain-containing protein [Gammaproteobacteria bacterium]